MKWIFLGLACLIGGVSRADRCKKFDPPQVDETLREVYAEIEGTTLEEKSHFAMTTLEMNAVSAVALRLARQKLAHAAEILYSSLDEEGQALMLKSHAAWEEHIRQQALFVTDACRNGSARSLYISAILKTETERRTRLYKELLDGATPFTTGLSMYE